MRTARYLTLIASVLALSDAVPAIADQKPNIVILYADDMGHGDLAIQNPESKIPTPNLDRLAREGLRFTDAHSSSGICTPSRYALLTGRYHWRKFHNIVRAFGASVFDPERLTLPEMLKEKGYRTACIGKWHLGWNWNAIKHSRDAKPSAGRGKKGYPVEAFDWSRPVPDGPLAHGFDYYFGDDVPNFPPYTWIENDRVLQAPTVPYSPDPKPAEGAAEGRPGPMVEGWKQDAVMPRLTGRVVEWIAQQKGSERPFFLYFPWTSPHAPIVPAKEFHGKTEAGGYGDFMFQSDRHAGQVLEALDRNGFRDNTLVVFTSDNGPERYAYERVRKHDHRSMGSLRGLKRDIWEGGHRIPFIVRWPGVVKPGTVSDVLISQIDLMATIASIVGFELPDDAAEDSHDLLPLLRGETDSVRDSHVHNTRERQFAVRHGDWVLIDAKSGGVSRVPGWFDEDNGYRPNAHPAALYNLRDDLAERKNRFSEHPEKVTELRALLKQIRERGHSAPRLRSKKKRSTTVLRAEDHVLHAFKRQQLTDVYYSEGAGAGDIDGDGKIDVVYGPYWFAGPDFQKKREIYPAKPQPRERYADNFFSWVHDFDGDGWNDVFVVGFPGRPAFVYENPTADKLDRNWEKHEVFDWVSNESPHFTDIVGDARPELVCTRDGFFGYATVDWKNPFKAWIFHIVSEKTAPSRFGHGLGVGDVNKDGRKDIVFSGGWLEQPENTARAARWTLHEASFTNAYGGAEMHVYDVDGDGDNDVITSLAAHDFGLAWYEQDQSDGKTIFRQRLIMGDRPERNRYGVVFSEPHSVTLVDMDGDGLKDIVTGKTYWSHHRKSPMWDAGAVVYWFRLVRGKDGVDWVPYRADGEAGIGRQVGVHDVNGDGLPDIVVGGMKGAHVLVQSREKVDEKRWRAAQPKRTKGTGKRVDRGTPAPLDESTGRVPGAIEGEEMKVARVGAGKVRSQDMTGFKKGRWSGGQQLFWTGAKPRARLELEIDVARAGTFDVTAVLTVARDYAIVNLLLDDEALGQPIDLFEYPDVKTTGVLDLGSRELTAGKHRLTVEIIGANDSAIKSYMVGLDYFRLVPRG